VTGEEGLLKLSCLSTFSRQNIPIITAYFELLQKNSSTNIIIFFFFDIVVGSRLCDTNFQFFGFQFHYFDYVHIQSSLFCKWIGHTLLGRLTACSRRYKETIELI